MGTIESITQKNDHLLKQLKEETEKCEVVSNKYSNTLNAFNLIKTQLSAKYDIYNSLCEGKSNDQKIYDELKINIKSLKEENRTVVSKLKRSENNIDQINKDINYCSKRSKIIVDEIKEVEEKNECLENDKSSRISNIESNEARLIQRGLLISNPEKDLIKSSLSILEGNISRRESQIENLKEKNKKCFKKYWKY